MIKTWTIFLSSILITNFTIGEPKVFESLTTTIFQHLPFHSDITFSANESETIRKEAGKNETVEDEKYLKETIIKWSDYANSWAQFCQYYQTIALTATGYADGKPNVGNAEKRKSFTNKTIATSTLKAQTTWTSSKVLRNSSQNTIVYHYTQFPKYSSDEAGVYYDAYRDNNYIKIRLYLWVYGYQYHDLVKPDKVKLWTESHVDYSGGSITSSIKPEDIKKSLTTALSNPITVLSNYSGSLEEKNNKANIEEKIKDVIKKTLNDDEDYPYWEKYLQPISLSDKTRKAITTFKVINLNNNQEVWTFETPISITLSHDYWGQNLKNRLTINPGKIVNPLDSLKGMIDDQPIQLEPNKVTASYGGNLQYHTTAHIEFDGAEDSNEWMTVNNQPVEVLNNRFIYNMVDNRDGSEKDDEDKPDDSKTSNVYDIVLHRKASNAAEEQYEVKYTIANLVPKLSAKWYGWDPEQNPDQKSLITETLPNGKTNPKYDKEVNTKTGTKTQIIWVKKKTEYPFPLDLLNQNGEVINSAVPSNYDQGFIAEGSVAGMGIQQLFNPNEIDSVWREGVDKNLNKYSSPNSQQQLKAINPDTEHAYWSWEGMWHYITKTTDKLAYEKYVLIGDNYQEKYSRFLDILNNADIAVDFWTTIHGLHLKNYLAREKQFDSKQIAELNYEQTVSYWKEYTSDIISQRIAPDPYPINYIDLNQINLYTIKMNLTTIELIKEEIIRQIRENLNKFDLIYTLDYVFYPFDDESINKLLDYDSNGNATINLTVSALSTSTKVIGSKTIKIINNIHYDPNNVVDLSKIEFFPEMAPFSFHNFTIEQLRQWILTYVNNTFKSNKNYIIALEYDIDYGITPFDDETLKQFINSKERTSLEFTVYAQDSSLKAINGTQFILINDPEAPTAPIVPPIINPIPNPNEPGKNSWIAKKTNLIILSVIVTLGVAGLATIIFVKYRLKKGIGGKKLKNSKTKEEIKPENKQ